MFLEKTFLRIIYFFALEKLNKSQSARVILYVILKFNIISLGRGCSFQASQKNISLIPRQLFSWQLKYFWFDDLCFGAFLFILAWHFFCCCTCTFFYFISFRGSTYFCFIIYVIFCRFSLTLLLLIYVQYYPPHFIVILCFRDFYSFCTGCSAIYQS